MDANRKPIEAEEHRHPEGTPPPPSIGRVREEDLEPHDGLRYIARLFKVLAILLAFLLIAEVAVGLQQEGTAALMPLLVEGTKIIVFAGFLWAAGDLAIMFIESNHDLRATRILLGRLNGRMERFLGEAPPAAGGPRTPRTPPAA